MSGPLRFILALTMAAAACAAVPGGAAGGQIYYLHSRVAIAPHGWELSLDVDSRGHLSVSLDNRQVAGEDFTQMMESHTFAPTAPFRSSASWGRRSLRLDTGSALGEFSQITLAMKTRNKLKRLRPDRGCSVVAVKGTLRGTFAFATSMPYFGTIIRRSLPATLITLTFPGAEAPCLLEPPPTSPQTPSCPEMTSIEGVADYGPQHRGFAFYRTHLLVRNALPDAFLSYDEWDMSGPMRVGHSLSASPPYGPERPVFERPDAEHATITGFGPFSGQASFTAGGRVATTQAFAGCTTSQTSTPGTWSGESFVAHFEALGDIFPFSKPVPGTMYEFPAAS